MTSDGKVQVVVRSRRVPVRTVDSVVPAIIGAGFLIYRNPPSERAVIYESVLDDEHRRAIEEGQRVANNLGLELQVVDLSKLGFLRRVLSSLGGNGSMGLNVIASPSSQIPASSRPVLTQGA
jgi:hypothetical protein